MKKLTGWLMVIFCSIFLLIFAIALIIFIPNLWTNYSSANMSVKEIIGSSIGFFVVITLGVYGLYIANKKDAPNKPNLS
jgi:polyferredoxin